MVDLPTVMGPEGLIPQTPAELYDQLLMSVLLLAPGYTSRLPGSLVEDISSTDVGAIIICDQARVETVNSLTPRGANAFLLNQLGLIYGVTIGGVTNTSVFVVFTTDPPTPGFVLAKGFIVSDGTFQYVLTDGGVTSSDGTTPPLFALATQAGIWPVSPDSVDQLVTSTFSGVTLTVTNPLAGTPGSAAESESSYRVRVLRAGLASSQGMPRYLKTKLMEVVGVQPRLVSVRQISTATFQIICGGSGDPYQIGGAIFASDFWFPGLVGSTIMVTAISNTNPGHVATNLNHGYTTGQLAEINGALGMPEINGLPFTVTVNDEKSFIIDVDTSGFGLYTGGGVLTPNFRNIVVDIDDFPDTYTIPFVTPPLQIVWLDVAWNTISPNFINPVGVAQLAQPALAAYINAITVGSPINLYELESVFRNSIAGILAPELLTRMVFTVTINGIVTAPDVGTGIIAGDPESYFSIVASDITVIQG